MIDDHRANGGIVTPAEKGVDHDPAHVEIERVDRGRTVQGQPPHGAVDGDKDGLAHFNSSRAVITRMISLVPSRI